MEKTEDIINNDEEMIELTEEEFLLESSRYNDIEAVLDVMNAGVVKINYQNKESLNSALRKNI